MRINKPRGNQNHHSSVVLGQGYRIENYICIYLFNHWFIYSFLISFSDQQMCKSWAISRWFLIAEETWASEHFTFLSNQMEFPEIMISKQPSEISGNTVEPHGARVHVYSWPSETKMLSLWWHFRHWFHFAFWQTGCTESRHFNNFQSVQPVIPPKWPPPLINVVWWRHGMGTRSALLDLCERNHRDHPTIGQQNTNLLFLMC